MIAQSLFFTVDLWPRLPPPNAPFTAAKLPVYRRQTTRLPPPNYSNVAPQTEHNLCLTSNVDVCIRNHLKYIKLY